MMKNAYEIRGDVTAIFIDSPKYGRQEALISTSELERVKEFPNSWIVALGRDKKALYVRGNAPKENGKYKLIHLHRWITNEPKGLVVDHINHNTLDNTNENLQIVTHGENLQNLKGPRKGSKSGIRGVTWHKRYKKWYSQMCVNGNYIRLGFFDDIQDAERAVIEARMKYMPFSQESTLSV